MSELDELKATVEEAERVGEQIIPLLSAAEPTVQALILADLVAAWILQRSGHDPARSAHAFNAVMTHVQKVICQGLERGPARPN